MAQKTNKSLRKRVKITKSGALKIRKIGQNHFNAKQSGTERMGKKRLTDVKLPKKIVRRFLPHHNVK